MTVEQKLAQRTERQRAIYAFIADEIRTKGSPPTFRGIGQRFGIKSSNGARCHLRALEKAGLIVTDRLKARGIRLVGGVTCPHCGERIDAPVKGEAA